MPVVSLIAVYVNVRRWTGSESVVVVSSCAVDSSSQWAHPNQRSATSRARVWFPDAQVKPESPLDQPAFHQCAL